MYTFLKLLQQYFILTRKAFFILCALLVVGQLLMVPINDTNLAETAGGFDSYIGGLGLPLLFLAAVVAVLGIIFYLFYTLRRSPKGVYGLMTLPVAREKILVAAWALTVSYLLVLVAVELVFMLCLYGWVVFFGGYGQFWLEILQGLGLENPSLFGTNGLYLGFVRSNFLRTLLPLDPLWGGYSLSVLCALSLCPMGLWTLEKQPVSALVSFLGSGYLLFQLGLRVTSEGALYGNGMWETIFFSLAFILVQGFLQISTIQKNKF